MPSHKTEPIGVKTEVLGPTAIKKAKVASPPKPLAVKGITSPVKASPPMQFQTPPAKSSLGAFSPTPPKVMMPPPPPVIKEMKFEKVTPTKSPSIAGPSMVTRLRQVPVPKPSSRAVQSPSLPTCTKSEVNKMSGMGLVGAAPKPPPPPPKSSPTPKSTPATPPKVSDLVVLDDDVPSPAPTLKDLEETQVQEHPAVPSATEPGVKKVDSTPTEVPKDCNALGGQPTSGESTTVSTKSVGPTGNDGQDPVETPTPTQKTVVPPEPTEVIAQASVESPTPKTVGPSEPNNVMGQNDLERVAERVVELEERVASMMLRVVKLTSNVPSVSVPSASASAGRPLSKNNL